MIKESEYQSNLQQKLYYMKGIHATSHWKNEEAYQYFLSCSHYQEASDILLWRLSPEILLSNTVTEEAIKGLFDKYKKLNVYCDKIPNWYSCSMIMEYLKVLLNRNAEKEKLSELLKLLQSLISNFVFEGHKLVLVLDLKAFEKLKSMLIFQLKQLINDYVARVNETYKNLPSENAQIKLLIPFAMTENYTDFSNQICAIDYLYGIETHLDFIGLSIKN